MTTDLCVSLTYRPSQVLYCFIFFSWPLLGYCLVCFISTDESSVFRSRHWYPVSSTFLSTRPRNKGGVLFQQSMGKHRVNTVLGYGHLNFGSQTQLLGCDLALEKIHDVNSLRKKSIGAAQRVPSCFWWSKNLFSSFFSPLWFFTWDKEI